MELIKPIEAAAAVPVRKPGRLNFFLDFGKKNWYLVRVAN